MQKQIVMAENRLFQRERNAMLLRNQGYEVFEAEDGQKPWEHINVNSLDLLVTDTQMPNMNGTTLINTQRQEGYQVPIIVVASNFDPSQVTDYNGQIEYLQKPFARRDDEDAFVKKVQELLRE